MDELNLILGPNPIFKKTATPVLSVDDEIVAFCDALCTMLYSENAIGIAAPMVGVLTRVIAYDMMENERKNPLAMINPEIIWTSEDTQSFEEASICFPGISADITRAKKIKVGYTDVNGDEQIMEAEGYLATVIQHEIDYLNGVIYLDYLTPMKKSMLLKRCKKYIRRSGF